jgi:hypothetical protein
MTRKKFNELIRVLTEGNNKIHVNLKEVIGLPNYSSKTYEASVWLSSAPSIEELNRLYALLRASIAEQKRIDKVVV